MRFKNLLIVAILVILLSGCAEVGDVFRIREQLVQKYNHKNIDINIENTKSMTIIFADSPFNKLEESQRQAKAEEIAVFCVGLFSEDSKIKQVSIIFTKHEKQFVIVDYTHTVGTYSFDVSQLKQILLKNRIQQSILNSIPKGI